MTFQLSYKNLTVGNILQFVQNGSTGIAMCVYEDDDNPEWASADSETASHIMYYEFKSMGDVAAYLKDRRTSDITLGNQGISEDEYLYFIFASNEIRDKVYQEFLKL